MLKHFNRQEGCPLNNKAIDKDGLSGRRSLHRRSLRRQKARARLKGGNLRRKVAYIPLDATRIRHSGKESRAGRECQKNQKKQIESQFGGHAQ